MKPLFTVTIRGVTWEDKDFFCKEAEEMMYETYVIREATR